jgi:hypothetical protein
MSPPLLNGSHINGSKEVKEKRSKRKYGKWISLGLHEVGLKSIGRENQLQAPPRHIICWGKKDASFYFSPCVCVSAFSTHDHDPEPEQHAIITEITPALVLVLSLEKKGRRERGGG